MFKKYQKRGYIIDKQGYVYLWMPKHSLCHSKGYVKRARYVMEQKLKRYLKPAEVVHHINGIKDDDRPKNLKLFPAQSEHMRGNIAWNRGLHTQTNTGRTHFKKGQKSWNKGKHIQTNTGRTHFKSGATPWNRGKHIYCGGKRFEKGQAPWNKGISCSENTKRKISETKKKLHIKLSGSAI